MGRIFVEITHVLWVFLLFLFSGPFFRLTPLISLKHGWVWVESIPLPHYRAHSAQDMISVLFKFMILYRYVLSRKILLKQKYNGVRKKGHILGIHNGKESFIRIKVYILFYEFVIKISLYECSVVVFEDLYSRQYGKCQYSVVCLFFSMLFGIYIKLKILSLIGVQNSYYRMDQY